MSFLQFFRILWARRALILLGVTGCFLAALLVVAIVPSRYVAETRIYLDLLKPDPVTGMIVDLKLVKDVINREVVEVYDHRFLNHEVPPFDQVVPTAENIARDIWGRLDGYFQEGPARLKNVRLYETDDLFVDYTGA